MEDTVILIELKDMSDDPRIWLEERGYQPLDFRSTVTTPASNIGEGAITYKSRGVFIYNESLAMRRFTEWRFPDDLASLATIFKLTFT